MAAKLNLRAIIFVKKSLKADIGKNSLETKLIPGRKYMEMN